MQNTDSSAENVTIIIERFCNIPGQEYSAHVKDGKGGSARVYGSTVEDVEAKLIRRFPELAGVTAKVEPDAELVPIGQHNWTLGQSPRYHADANKRTTIRRKIDRAAHVRMFCTLSIGALCIAGVFFLLGFIQGSSAAAEAAKQYIGRVK